ncbi:sulfite exporter TauE/SafE family protein [Oxyplasma meridianum]|uniref:Probable membrane transporter protein n=1 Tax=Oxyplasma meridianum TaxID=3073602 RepID=A0AAX4NFD3_9ARCH
MAAFVGGRPLEVVFSIVAFLMAIQSFRRSRSGINLKHMNLPHPYILGFLISLLIETLTETLGSSGKIMFIAVMMLLYSLDAKTMVGTATLLMFISAVSGTAGYVAINRIDIVGGMVIGAVSLLSGFYFARKALSMKEITINIFLGSVFLLVSILESITIIASI